MKKKIDNLVEEIAEAARENPRTQIVSKYTTQLNQLFEVKMAKDYYYLYQLTQTDGQVDELEDLVRNGKAEYVAGKLIGMLKSNGKIVYPKKADLEEEVVG